MNPKSSNPLLVLENQELIQKLIDHGYGDIVDCLLSNEATVYTKKGRLNKSSTCRELGCKNKDLETAIKKMRELLQKDLAIED